MIQIILNKNQLVLLYDLRGQISQINYIRYKSLMKEIQEESLRKLNSVKFI